MPRSSTRARLAIGVLLVSTFVVILNETIMSVALPHLMGDFDIEASAAQWLTTAFLLTMAVVIPTTGVLLRRVSTTFCGAVLSHVAIPLPSLSANPPQAVPQYPSGTKQRSGADKVPQARPHRGRSATTGQSSETTSLIR